MTDLLTEKYNHVCDLIDRFDVEDDVVCVRGVSHIPSYKLSMDAEQSGERYVEIAVLEQGESIPFDGIDIPFPEKFIEKLKQISCDGWDYLGTDGDPGCITIVDNNAVVEVGQEQELERSY